MTAGGTVVIQRNALSSRKSRRPPTFWPIGVLHYFVKRASVNILLNVKTDARREAGSNPVLATILRLDNVPRFAIFFSQIDFQVF